MDAIANFVISSITAAILGVVVSMNVYALNQRLHYSPLKENIEKVNKISSTSTASSLFSGSSLSILSTVCASCSSSIGLVLTSVFGTALGASVSAFLSNYQTPLRIVSILILLWSWYSISKSLSTKGYCLIPDNRTNN
jgi:Na+/H+-translocating membrane pyrophosphatase